MITLYEAHFQTDSEWTSGDILINADSLEAATKVANRYLRKHNANPVLGHKATLHSIDIVKIRKNSWFGYGICDQG